jgi:KDO2-lipid IV(A) lauroyltransferase
VYFRVLQAMKAILYFIALPFIYLVSLLPFRVLHVISDMLYLVMYKGLGYRKHVVLKNMRNAFPDKDEREIRILCNRFYRNFCDALLESVKAITISAKAIRRHFLLEDTAAWQKFYEQGQSVIIANGHMGNWEISGMRLGLAGLHTVIYIYKPLKNKYFDRLVHHMRTRLGVELYARKETVRKMHADKSRLTATAFIADQTPPPENAYWTTFLNQDTPVFQGMEKLARKFNYPVIYISISRLKRGYYQLVPELLADDPASLPPTELTERFSRRLEQDIRAQPESWLWTHRRWKHRRA